MRQLPKTVLALVAILSIPSISIAASSSSDPFQHCDLSNKAAFCGNKPISTTYNSNSCFERVAVAGCKVVEAPFTAICQWGIIYDHGENTSMTNQELCANQARFCQKHNKAHPDDQWPCAQDNANCLKSQQYFRGKPKKLSYSCM